jgi:hypothetical protein
VEAGEEGHQGAVVQAEAVLVEEDQAGADPQVGARVPHNNSHSKRTQQQEKHLLWTAGKGSTG